MKHLHQNSLLFFLSRLCIKMGFSTSMHQTKTAEVSGWKHWRKVTKCHSRRLEMLSWDGLYSYVCVLSVTGRKREGFTFAFTLSTEIAIVNFLAVGGARGGTRERQTSWASHFSPIGILFSVFRDVMPIVLSTYHWPATLSRTCCIFLRNPLDNVGQGYY